MAKKEQIQDNLPRPKQAIRDQNPERLYIFHGEEVYLLHHYLSQLEKKLLDPMTADFNHHRFTQENFTVQGFLDAVENLPMMAPRSLVQVDEMDLFKLPEEDREKLAELFSDLPEYCTVVFTYETTPWKPDKRLKKLWTALEKNACIVEFAKQSQRDLVAWITRHFAAAGKSISQDLCLYLMDITGGTMTALGSEIQKIIAYSGASAICKADIDAVTEPVLDAVVFQMTDLLGEGQYGKALEKLQQLIKMQQEPIAILGAIGTHLRRLSTARTLLDCGKGSQELMQLCGLSDYPARKTMSAAGRTTASFCAKACSLVLETDRAMKTSYDDPQRLLELLVLQLAQEASHD